MTQRTGPFEDLAWPERLRAMVIDPNPRPHLHGYDVERDLAKHYTMVETMLLALTGAAPEAREGRAFELALVFASMCPINEAPTHAAVLARTIGAPLASSLAAGLIVACEAAQASVHEQEELLGWLGDAEHDGAPASEVPRCALAASPRDVEATAALRIVLDQAGALALAPEPNMSKIAAIITVMWRCGLKSSDQLVVALTWAKTLSIGAEAVAAKLGGMVNMPVHLPEFRYEAPRR